MKKKTEKDSDEFWKRNLTSKVKFWDIFDTSPPMKFSKFNDFLWVCWFLDKNLSNFVSPDLNLHNLAFGICFPISMFWKTIDFLLGGMGQRMPEIYKNILGALQNISIPLLTISESLIESNEKEIQKVMDENTR